MKISSIRLVLWLCWNVRFTKIANKKAWYLLLHWNLKCLRAWFNALLKKWRAWDYWLALVYFPNTLSIDKAVCSTETIYSCKTLADFVPFPSFAPENVFWRLLNVVCNKAICWNKKARSWVLLKRCKYFQQYLLVSFGLAQAPFCHTLSKLSLRQLRHHSSYHHDTLLLWLLSKKSQRARFLDVLL